MKNTNLKLLVLALVGLFLANCQRDDAPEVLPQEEPVPTVDPQAVVSLNEAKSLFEASENQKRMTNSVSRSNYPLIELETNWRYFEQMQTLTGDAYAKVSVRISRTELNGEVLFLKKDGKTKQYLFFTKADSIAADRRIINANFYLFDTKGVFLSACQMRNGVITHKLVPKRKGSYRIIDNNGGSTTGRSGMPICGTCTLPFSDNFFYYWEDPHGGEEEKSGGRNCIELEPVTVTGIGGGNKKNNRNPNFPNYPYYDYLPINNWEENYDRRHEEDDDIWAKRRKFQNSSNIGAGMAKEEEKKEEKKQDKREDTIKDSLTTPCAKALLAQAPTLANDIATLLNKTFGTNKNIDITIYNKPFTDKSLVDSDAYSMLAKDVITDGEHHIDVYVHLNDNVLKTATQEYILATIYHEVLHGFLDVERQVLGEQVFHQKYPSVEEVKLPIGNGQRVKKYKLIQKQDHDKFAPYIESLAQSIMSLPNSKISLKTARAMAKVGIVEGSSLSDEEKLINQGQRNGTDPTGIKCP